MENESPKQAQKQALRKTAVSGCFFSLIIRTLENILKISLKKFADSKKALYICIVKQLKQNKMTTETKKSEQSNYYNVVDSMGRPTSIYIIASNIKEACAEAKKRQAEIGSAYYKVKRAYNGGVRG